MLFAHPDDGVYRASRADEAVALLDAADAALLRLWQMTAGADGTDLDKEISEACIHAQVGVRKARKGVKLALSAETTAAPQGD